MSCERYGEQFTDFLEGTLPEQDWRELELHLQQCDQCAVAIKAFRRTVSALRSLALVEPPRALPRTITERIARETTAPAAAVPVVKVKPARRRVFPWSAAGALATACLVVAIVAVYNLRQQPAPAGPTAAPPSFATPASESVPPTAESAPPEAGATESPAASESTSPASSRPATSGGGRVAPSGPGGRGGDRRSTGTGSVMPGPAPTGPTGVKGDQAPPAPSPPGTAGRGGTEGAMTAKSVPPPAAVAFGPGGDAAGGMGAGRAGTEPVSMDIKVDPPGARRVGDWGPLNITLTSGSDVPQVTVCVECGDSLQVRGSKQLYSGPLRSRTPKHLSAQIRADEAGSHSVRVVLSSPTAGASTSVRVPLRGYASEPGTTRRSFRSVTLGEAARAVAGDCGLSVQVAPALSGRRVSADFSGGLSGTSALRSLAGMVGGQLVATDGGYRIVPDE